MDDKSLQSLNLASLLSFALAGHFCKKTLAFDEIVALLRTLALTIRAVCVLWAINWYDPNVKNGTLSIEGQGVWLNFVPSRTFKVEIIF